MDNIQIIYLLEYYKNSKQNATCSNLHISDIVWICMMWKNLMEIIKRIQPNIERKQPMK